MQASLCGCCLSTMFVSGLSVNSTELRKVRLFTLLFGRHFRNPALYDITKGTAASAASATTLPGRRFSTDLADTLLLTCFHVKHGKGSFGFEHKLKPIDFAGGCQHRASYASLYKFMQSFSIGVSDIKKKKINVQFY